jgi:Lrp/AsnC family transcriptional regulator
MSPPLRITTKLRDPLDKTDLQIFDLLQRDASLSTADLAVKVGISQSPGWSAI